ncbi:MFS transporter [Nocardia acididurans]|uniref:MFS transporter n=1 Tax=Nocardia acididurans TaxID=2802282 RepID=UPI0027DE1D6D|nr:MFS transporter [Nocardia acididurans]
MSTLASFRSFPVSVRLLLANHLAGNIGFYLLIPFLADYLLSDLGLSAAVVGVVLSVRNLSQQGLFLVGGTVADRIGPRGVIITGAAIRAIGFALFAVGGSVPVVLAASVLTGFAGALFNPAVRAYIARDSAERSAAAFALFNVFGNVGSAVGPILGTVLVAAGFRLTALVSAGIFAGLTLAQVAFLPARPVEHADGGVLRDLRKVFSHRVFWAFSFAMMANLALQSQIYFLLTLQAQHAAGRYGAGAVAALYAVETVAMVLLQVRITRWFGRRPARGPALATGMAVMGATFLIPPLTASVLGVVAGDGLAPTVIRVLPTVAAVAGLALGIMIAQPFANELIPRFSGPRLTGTYYGAYYLVAGVGTLVFTSLVGTVVDLSAGPLSWGPGSLCAAAGFLSAAGLLALHRRGLLPAAEPDPPHPDTSVDLSTSGERRSHR